MSAPRPFDLSDHIAFHTYENQRKMWPHLPDRNLPKPARYDDWKARRPETLRLNEVKRLYEAVAFAMWQHGIVMNTHLTIKWASMGVYEASQATKVLGEYNAEAAKWLRVGKVRKDVIRAGRRYGYGANHVYVHVHENGGREGFHTHQLCHVPLPIAGDFERWSRKCLARLSRQTGISKDAFFPVMKKPEAELCWLWFRYLIKQLDRRIEIRDNDGAWQPVESIFKPWPLRQMKPLPVERAVAVSHNLGSTERKKAGFVSRYVTGEWDGMFSGKELEEHRERLETGARMAEMKELIETLSL